MEHIVDNLMAGGRNTTDTILKSGTCSEKIELDLSGTNPNNKITNEIHHVSKDTNSNIIRPMAGSFFGNTLLINHSGRLLEEGVDYILGCGQRNILPVKDSINPIYDYIYLLEEHYRSLVLSYQAVGGNISQVDSVRCNCKAKNKNARVSMIEKQLLGHVTLPIRGETASSQWFNIAEFGLDSQICGNFNLNIYSPIYGWGYHIAIAINILSYNKMSVVVINENPKHNVFNIDNYKSFKHINNNLVKLRLVWNGKYEDGKYNEYSGCVLQLGYSNGEFETDNINVELSSFTNKLSLLPVCYDTTPLTYCDKVILPTGDVWNYKQEDSHHVYSTLCGKSGYDMWIGDYSLNDIPKMSTNLDTSLADSNRIKLEMVSKVYVVMYDREGNHYKSHSNDHFGIDILCGEINIPGDITVIYIITNSNGKLALAVSVDGDTSDDRYTLKKISLKF